MGKKNGRRAFLADPSNLKPLESDVQKMLMAVVDTPSGSCNKFRRRPKAIRFWTEEDLVVKAIQPRIRRILCEHHRFADIDKEHSVFGAKGLLVERESW